MTMSFSEINDAFERRKARALEAYQAELSLAREEFQARLAEINIVDGVLTSKSPVPAGSVPVRHRAERRRRRSDKPPTPADQAAKATAAERRARKNAARTRQEHHS